MLRDMAGLRMQLARVTGSVELSKDLIQDAIVTALQKLKRGEISTGAHLDGYVYRIAVNHYLNHRRKQRTAALEPGSEAEIVDAEAASRPVAEIETAQWARIVKQLLREVKPARDRELLVSYYLYEESKDDLCRRFGLTELHFNRVIFRARDRFRDMLEQRGFGRSDFLSIAV
jgi:RNA polymerase sigma-70 factor (ECF subfamily)